jgi:cytochrome P450
MSASGKATDVRNPQLLDRDELRRLFDLRSSYNAHSGGDYTDDPYPIWRELRERAPVHEGTVHELTGYGRAASFQGLPFPDRPHFSVFSYEACDNAYRDDELFASSPEATGPDADEISVTNSMLSMGGTQHRRYRSLVQPSFVPAKAQWWISNWIDRTVHLLIDGLVGKGRAELNVDFAAAIPVLTITGSFGVPVDQALVIRESLQNPMKIVEILTPIVEARRERPQEDLISVLVEAEYTDEDSVTHRLSDPEIYSFALLLLAAGSGTTWKQMGITITALLERPEMLDAVRDDRQLLRSAIEESLRWMPTDPMFSRFVTRDVDFHGAHLPRGAVLHLCIGAANRDPARWDRPDEFDIGRTPKPTLAFGSGPHICIGMHVARAEMAVGIGALLDRLPNLRLDPDVEPPRFVGMYERGATEIPVVFG